MERIPVMDSWETPEKLQNDLNQGIAFRYATSITVCVVLYVFRNHLPFPFPHFMLVAAMLLLTNAVVHVLSSTGRFRRFLLYPSCAYLDTLFAPFVIHFTGGFLSPFIFTHYVTAVACVYSSASGANHGRSVITMVVVSYVGVSILQKYGVLPNQVAYSRDMMSNTVFFFYILITVAGVMIGGFLLLCKLKNNLHFDLKEMLHAYQEVVEGTASGAAGGLFKSLVSHLAEAMHARYALIGEVTEDGTALETLAFFEDDRIVKNVRISLCDTSFGAVVENRQYCSSSGVRDRFPEDPLLARLRAESFRGVVLEDSSDNTIGVICIIHDKPGLNEHTSKTVLGIFASRAAAEIERKRIEEEKREMEARLAQSQKLEAIGQLAGGVAHDFNNLLGGILGNADLLETKLAKDSPLRRYTERILTASSRAADLTRQLLSFARKGKYRTECVDIHTAISEVVSILSHTIDKRIVIKQHLEASPSITLGDPSQLQNMLLNVAINARDAMPEGGELVFYTSTVTLDENHIVNHPESSTFEPGSYLLAAVSDTGCGMDSETVSHIFEPFFTTKEPGKGTGLGLAAVYGCMRSHHGFVEVESDRGKGTTFKLYLPLHKNTEKSLGTDGSDARLAGSGAHLLIVDDEVDVLDTLSEALGEFGYRVKACNDGREALDYFNRNSDDVDLVIVDMIMPGMNGKDVFRAMKEINPSVRAILVSGYSLEKEASEMLSDGIIDLVQKPFRTGELAQKIEGILGRS